MAKRGYVEAIRKNDLKSRKDKVINLRRYNNANNLLDIRAACRTQETGNMSMYSLGCWFKVGEDKAQSIKTKKLIKRS